MKEVMRIEKLHHVDVGPVNYLTLGKIYYELNQLDSAITNYEKAIESPNIRTKAGTYTSLFYAYKKKGEHQQAAKYLEKGWILKDSIAKAEKNEVLIEMQEKYDQQQIINEKNELEIKKNQTILRVLVCLIIAIITIAIISYTYQKKLMEKERLIKQANQTIHNKTLQITENESTIKRNEARIMALSEEIGIGLLPDVFVDIRALVFGVIPFVDDIYIVVHQPVLPLRHHACSAAGCHQQNQYCCNQERDSSEHKCHFRQKYEIFRY